MNAAKSIALGALARLTGPAIASRLAFAYRDHLSSAAMSYRYSSAGRKSLRHLRSLRDKFTGQRCYIIGNGPSLAGMDLSPLRDEYTFGLNRGYLLFDRIGGPTTFLVAVNRHVIEQFGSDIAGATSAKFLSWHSRDLVANQQAVTFLRWSQGPRFSEDVARQGAWEGATVTFVAMQLAFHMGFHEVVLIGVDHSFAATGKPHALVTSTNADADHFDPGYFGPGVRWQLPDLETSEVAYRLAKHHFERAGRRIVDATVGGKLAVFPKADYSEMVERPLG